jgi:hypothetical protein
MQVVLRLSPYAGQKHSTAGAAKVFAEGADILPRACTVTLLVLLISIAVLEYVIRRPDPAPGQSAKTTKNQGVTIPEPGPPQSPSPTLAPALLQLGRAVEQFGRGPVPQPSPPEPIPKEPKKVS